MSGRSRAWSQRVRRRRPARRAVSEVIGALIVGAIILTGLVVYTGFVIRSQQSNNVAVEARLGLDREQERERFTVTGVGPLVGANVTNEGPLPLQVAYVVVIRNTDGVVVGSTAASTTVEPGTTSTPVLTSFPFTGAATAHTYTVKVVTTRGNIGYDTYPPPPPPVQTPASLGFLVIKFDQFEYAQRNMASQPWGPWTPAWNVHTNKFTVWRVNMTNLRDVPFTIRAISFMLQFHPDSEQHLGWFIVNATLQGGVDAYTATGTNATVRLNSTQDYAPDGHLVIPALGWRWVYFTGSKAGTDCSPPGPTCDAEKSVANNGRSYATDFLMYGYYGTPAQVYAQTIPFPGVKTVP